MILGVAPEEIAAEDISQNMLNSIIDMEKELSRLKMQLKEEEKKKKINEDDVVRLKSLQQELQAVMSE